ncbi:MAG: MFS transporter [Muribaculaceae bacterium]|nr:MFS transporter [Muribaculaceae bacterium]
MKAIRLRLSIMNFLEFAVWGAYLTSLGSYLFELNLASKIGIFYAIQGIVSIFMPALIGMVADRWLPAQKTLSLCHLIAGLSMCGAGMYAMQAGNHIEFAPLFSLYAISVAFFMPTIGIANSVAYTSLNRAGLDTIKHFPPIRVFGTVGFICAMLFSNFTGYQDTYGQLLTSGILSLVLAGYSLTMPACPVNKSASRSMSAMLGLNAFKLFKDKQMAVFFIFSMLLGVSLQITNGFANPFIKSFKDMATFSDTFGANNANALISLSQMSETLCILLIPFFLKRFGIKIVMLMSMVAWVFRFGFFGLGNPGSGVWLFIASMIVYGIAFDFFNVSGSLYVDQKTDNSIRSSAQGLFMLMTNGIGATIGTLGAQVVINHFVPTFPAHEGLLTEAQSTELFNGWSTSWFIFAGYSLVVSIMFFLIFKNPDNKINANEETQVTNDILESPEGMV